MVCVADAVQAYIQAELGGNICWVNLPSEAWPEKEDGMGFLKDKEELRPSNMVVY